MKMRFRALPLLLAALSLPVAGCGSAAPSPVGKPSPAALVLSEKDFGHSFTAVPGQQVEVNLTDRRPFPGSSLVWTVTSSDASALSPAGETLGSAAPARDDAYRATFTAHGSGTATLNAIGKTTCEAMQKSACPDRTERFTIRIG